jgi:hypothetical protein
MTATPAAFTRAGRNGRSHVTYTPTTVLGDTHTHLKIDIYYSKGGTNVWHGTTEPRGYWLSLGAVEVRENSIIETLSLRSDGFGKRIFLKGAASFSAKRFAEVVMMVRTAEAELVRLALVRDYSNVSKVAKEALGIAA